MRKSIVVTVLLTVGLLGCASSQRGQAVNGPVASSNTGASMALDDFVGDWGYASDCNFGHYVGVLLSKRGEAMTGEWSDGTRVRGWSGQLRGTLRNEKLFLQKCYEGEGEPLCPAYEEAHDILERRGEALVWYTYYNNKASEYLVLERSPSKAPRDLGCEEDRDDM